ncbi:hypothetical protein HS048_04725 [Planomonospora sp. ID91781]|uniref:hypothetical protein n=1 Tax=Planomonospora sp. ID91781 TaxID=2738135 RepID=UPI0018C3561B|nr:hypothetical protein [Planomonospora sp. ID91781]MBG0820042.1 hypothetical protein [Planomonospora sp. ID91781]
MSETEKRGGQRSRRIGFETGMWVFVFGPFFVTHGAHDVITHDGWMEYVFGPVFLIFGATSWWRHAKIAWRHVKNSSHRPV